MKKITSIFCKKKTTERPTIGITDAEYLKITDAINEEYESAHARQKPDTKNPSGYMKGLKRALEIVGSIEPHIMGGK